MSCNIKVPPNGKYRGYRPERPIYLIDLNFRAVNSVADRCSFVDSVSKQLDFPFPFGGTSTNAGTVDVPYVQVFHRGNILSTLHFDFV